MDETAVRQAAQDHAEGVVAGDLRRAGGHLTRAAVPAAPEVTGRLPPPVTAAEIVAVRAEDDGWVAEIRYRGGETEAVVESSWADVEGTPKIVGLRVV